MSWSYAITVVRDNTTSVDVRVTITDSETGNAFIRTYLDVQPVTISRVDELVMADTIKLADRNSQVGALRLQIGTNRSVVIETAPEEPQL